MTPPPTDPPLPPSPLLPSSRPVRRRTGGWLGSLLMWGCVTLVVALLLVTGFGRTVRSPSIPLSAAVAVLPYLYGLVAALLFAAWTLVPDRRMPPLLMLGVLLVGGGLWGGALSSYREQADGLPIRMVSWNVRRLWGGPEDGGDAARCVIQTLQDLDPDVLSLQEVSTRELEGLKDALDLTCIQKDYLGRGDPEAGGLAACVRGDRWTLRTGSAPRFVDDKEWRYIFSEIEAGGRVFNLLAVHLQPYRLLSSGLSQANDVGASQGDQSAELLRRVGRFQDPTLVAGDFNSTRDAALHVALRSTLVDVVERGAGGFAPTVHLMAWLPVRIDFVYATQDFAVAWSDVPDRDCSDHRPIVSDLVLRQGTAPPP